MKISELKIRQSNVDVNGIITEMGEIRTFDRFGRELRVANAVIKDDSGSIKLTLWNDDTNLKEGDKIKIINGYINEFQGEKQLTAGKFGKIEVVEGSKEKGDDEKEDKEDLEEAEKVEEDKGEEQDNEEENIENSLDEEVKEEL